jgi:LacI family transcriptional regulator
VEGILVSVSRTTQDFTHFEKVQKRGIPLVFFDRILQETQVNSVVVDDYAGAFQSTAHLIAQGCQRIAHLAGPQHLNIYKYRRQGYLDALAAHGLPLDEELIVYCDTMTLEVGTRAMQQLLKLAAPPDAVFSASDLAVVGALQALDDLGLRVPHDVALVGFSNEAFEQIGQAAVRLFLELREGKTEAAPRQIVLPPTLCVRASSTRL